jgi:hypothetical protein
VSLSRWGTDGRSHQVHGWLSFQKKTEIEKSGRTYMITSQETKTLPTGLSDEDASAELVKRIRKLRWIGMDDEAEKLQRELKRLPVTLCGSVLADPYGTD